MVRLPDKKHWPLPSKLTKNDGYCLVSRKRALAMVGFEKRLLAIVWLLDKE